MKKKIIFYIIILFVNIFTMKYIQNSWEINFSDKYITCSAQDAFYIFWGTHGGVLKYSKTENKFKNSISVLNGLPKNEILSILPDKHCVWIGTTGGLSKYIENIGIIETYTKTNGLLSNSILSILEVDNSLRCLAHENGVSFLNIQHDTFSFIKTNTVVKDLIKYKNKIYGIGQNLLIINLNNMSYVINKKYRRVSSAVQYNGNLYLGEYNKIIRVNCNNLEDSIVLVTGLNSKVHDMFIENNVLWFTTDYGFYKFSLKHKMLLKMVDTAIKFLHRPLAIITIEKYIDTFYLGTVNDGIYTNIINNQKFKKLSLGLFNQKINLITGQENKLLFCSNESMYFENPFLKEYQNIYYDFLKLQVSIMDINTKKFTYLIKPSGLNGSNKINDMCIDNDKYYFATDDGIIVYNLINDRYSNINTEHGLLDNRIKCIDVMNDNIYVGTQYGISIYNEKTKDVDNVTLHNNKMLLSNVINDICTDKTSVYFATGNGIVKYNPAEKMWYNNYTDELGYTRNGIFLSKELFAVETTDTFIFVGTEKGLEIFDKINLEWEIVNQYPGISDGKIIDLVYDKDELFIIGSGQLAKYNYIKQFWTTYKTIPFLNNVTLLDLFIYKENLYIGTSKGYIRFFYTNPVESSKWLDINDFEY